MLLLQDGVVCVAFVCVFLQDNEVKVKDNSERGGVILIDFSIIFLLSPP